jgi:hypothetical protein
VKNMLQKKNEECVSMKEDEREREEELEVLRKDVEKYRAEIGGIVQESIDLKDKHQKTCMNVSELVTELRSRQNEIHSKDEEIDQLKKKQRTEIQDKNEITKRLEENITQVRNENVRVKNNLKHLQQNNTSAGEYLRKEEFISFQEEIRKEIKNLRINSTDENIRKKNKKAGANLTQNKAPSRGSWQSTDRSSSEESSSEELSNSTVNATHVS